MSRPSSGGYLARPAPQGLSDVIDVILDKGIVIDAYVRVSLVGIELLTIDARVVVASVDTYLRFAEATNRLDLWDKGGESLTDVIAEETSKAAEDIAGHVVGNIADAKLGRVGDTLGEPAEKVARKAGGKALELLERRIDTER